MRILTQRQRGTNPTRFGAALRTSHKNRPLVIAGVLFVPLWELAAQIVQHYAARPEHVLPSIAYLVGSFRGLSDYWEGGFGVDAPQTGGKQTSTGAVLVLATNSLISCYRLVLGMLLSVGFGVGAGLLIGYVRWIRRFAFGPLNFLGVLPLLAMLPLFAFWFGPTTSAVVLFIFFGAGILILRSTLNAVENVPTLYVQNAQTMGASRGMIYRTVIIPAILPELRGGIAIALTFSWSFVLGAELVGVQDGLGRIMIVAMDTSHVDRMVIIGAVFVLLAAVTVIAFNRFADFVIRWAD